MRVGRKVGTGPHARCLLVPCSPAAPGGGPLVQRAIGTGGAGGIRTPDIRLAKAALSQLSYGPGIPGGPSWIRTRDLSLIRTAL
jgi:hypothetical protein